jgi:hypothetical protein
LYHVSPATANEHKFSTPGKIYGAIDLSFPFANILNISLLFAKG